MRLHFERDDSHRRDNYWNPRHPLCGLAPYKIHGRLTEDPKKVTCAKCKFRLAREKKVKVLAKKIFKEMCLENLGEPMDAFALHRTNLAAEARARKLVRRGAP